MTPEISLAGALVVAVIAFAGLLLLCLALLLARSLPEILYRSQTPEHRPSIMSKAAPESRR